MSRPIALEDRFWRMRALGTGGTTGPVLPINPSTLTALTCDLDAENPAIVLAVSDVDQWPDATAAGNLFIAPAAGNRPLLATGFNGTGKKYVQFDGVGEYVMDSTFAMGGSITPVSVSFVAIGDTYASTRVLFAYGASSQLVARYSAVNSQLDIGRTTMSRSTSNSVGVAKLWTYVADGTTQQIYCNGVLEDNDPNAFTTILTGVPFALGASVAGTSFAAYSVARFLVQRAVITPQELAGLYAYCQATYGLV